MSKGGNRPGAGRPKGSKNKTTTEVRALLTSAIADELESIPEYLEKVSDPEKKLNILAKFLPYIAPRLQSAEPLPNPKPEADQDYSVLTKEELQTLLAIEEKLSAHEKEAVV